MLLTYKGAYLLFLMGAVYLTWCNFEDVKNGLALWIGKKMAHLQCDIYALLLTID